MCRPAVRKTLCTADTCITGKYCVPAGPETPHRYKCVECFRNAHCPQGMECTESFSCAKIDPCRQAVCSPGAPFCVGIPYKTLPYTCVQCTSDAHCPPVGGLTRRCVDHFCLFNVPGNIPAPNPASAPSVQKKRRDIGKTANGNRVRASASFLKKLIKQQVKINFRPQKRKGARLSSVRASIEQIDHNFATIHCYSKIVNKNKP